MNEEFTLPELDVPYIYQVLDIDNKFQLAISGTHCKTCIFETEGGKK